MRNIDIEELIELIQIFAVPNAEIKEDTKILELNFIDSMNVIQIIAEIEGKYSLKIGAMDLSFDDFESPQTLKVALDKI